MRITVFTSNQSRHVSLIKRLASIADEVFAIQECNTIFPGKVKDFFEKSDTMQRYFNNVIEAELTTFGGVDFLPNNVRSIAIKSGDLNRMPIESLKDVLNSDYYVVFGSSFIKGDLVDFLVENKAVNIHMGLSPYYRGSSCNFWALYDDRPDYVGATIHLLSKGLDSGPMLFHAVPKAQKTTPFLLGMKAVASAHQGLVESIESGELLKLQSFNQNKDLEIRYTRNSDFNDAVALSYLESPHSESDIYNSLKDRRIQQLLNPFVY